CVARTGSPLVPIVPDEARVALAATPVLRVRIIAESKPSGDQLKQLSIEVGRALAIWRRACPVCPVGVASIIDVEGTVLLDNSLMALDRVEDFDAFQRSGDWARFLQFLRPGTGRTGSAPSYEPFDRSGALARKLCAFKSALPPVLRELRAEAD